MIPRIIPSTLRILCLALTLAVSGSSGQAVLSPLPARLTLKNNGTNVVLSWQSRSVITNANRTLVFPAEIVQVSADLTNWWDTAVIFPQQIGGLARVIQTNLPSIPVLPVFFIRVRGEPVDLSHANLTGADLRGVDLSGQDLSYATLTGALLNGASFTSADLSYAKLDRAVASTALFVGAKAQRLTGTDADFRQTQWQGAVLTSAKLERSDFEGSNLDTANMDNISALQTRFSACLLHHVSLNNAICDEADFTNADFLSASLDHASFANAYLHSVDFEETYGRYAIFYGAILSESIIRDSNFSGADFRSTDFRDSELERTDFRFCDFRGANLSDVTYRFCDFTGAQFWGHP